MLFFSHHVCRSVGHLGSGQFANVEEGTWKKGVNKEIRVALKTMKPGSTEEDKIEFLQEAAIMAQFQHPNVVSLYGIVNKGEPVSVCTLVCLSLCEGRVHKMVAE